MTLVLADAGQVGLVGVSDLDEDGTNLSLQA